MAARKIRGVGQLPDSWKEKIKTSVIVDRLSRHIDGTLELSNSQIRAADILLKKMIPDMARTEFTGKDGAAIETKSITKTDAEILAQYINKGAAK